MNRSLDLKNPRILVIGIAAFVAFLLTYLATSPVFVKPLYESKTILYVPLFVPARQIENQGIGFASDKEIDGHIQILISGRIKDTLAIIYDLYNHYEIDESAEGAKSILYGTIDQHVDIQKTRYSSVSIAVKDESPVMAAKMANNLALLGDIIKEELLLINRKNALSFAQKVEKKQEKLLSRLKQQRDSLISKNRNDTVSIRKEISGLDKLLYREYENLLTKTDNVRKEKDNLATPLPTSYVLTQATPSHAPVWPPRFLLSIAAFVLVGAGTWFLNLLFGGDTKS